jgi:hypothetical protein
MKSPCPGCQGPRRRPHDSNELIQFHKGANPSCPACIEFRLHTNEEYRIYHRERAQATGTDNRNAPVASQAPTA